MLDLWCTVYFDDKNVTTASRNARCDDDSQATNRSTFNSRIVGAFVLCLTLQTTVSLAPQPRPVAIDSRRSWFANAKAWTVGTAACTALAEKTPAVELLYKKQEVLQGKIFRKERASKASELEKTFVDARKAASDFEASLELGGIPTVNQVRLALRAKPFVGIRKDGKEIIGLMEADDEAFNDWKSRETLETATAAFKDVLDSLEEADQTAFKVVREGGPHRTSQRSSERAAAAFEVYHDNGDVREHRQSSSGSESVPAATATGEGEGEGKKGRRSSRRRCAPFWSRALAFWITNRRKPGGRFKGRRRAVRFFALCACTSRASAPNPVQFRPLRWRGSSGGVGGASSPRRRAERRGGGRRGRAAHRFRAGRHRSPSEFSPAAAAISSGVDPLSQNARKLDSCRGHATAGLGRVLKYIDVSING